jgi:hypothetical protein
MSSDIIWPFRPTPARGGGDRPQKRHEDRDELIIGDLRAQRLHHPHILPHSAENNHFLCDLSFGFAVCEIHEMLDQQLKKHISVKRSSGAEERNHENDSARIRAE